MFRGFTALASRRVARRWLPFASIPLVLALALGVLALRAQPHPVAATLPACSTPDATGTACPTPSPSATDTATATATDTPSATPSATITDTPSASATTRPTLAPTPAPFPSAGESAVLIPSDAVSGDDVGGAVALTPDGSEVVVGAINTNNRDGAAYVLTKGSGGWTQTARFTVADAPEGGFGNAVAVSADGSTALVAASLAGNGKAYVFSRGPSGWTQTAELAANDGRNSNDSFGHIVSLSADGRTAAISRPGYSYQGMVYIFTRSASGWSSPAVLAAPSPQPNDGFGNVLALDGSGTRLVLGYPSQPSAEVYGLSGGVWSHTATLTDARSSRLGATVAISADGTTVLVGDTGFYASTASVYAFRQSGSTWTPEGTIPNPGPANGGFGVALSLDSSGTRALTGDYGPGHNQGSAYLDEAAGGTWTTAQQLRNPLATAYDGYGNAVALDADGGVAAIGARASSGTGAVLIFDGSTPKTPLTVHC